ncbi:transglutaminase TgpA family protein [Schinkia sp. CFF1]
MTNHHRFHLYNFVLYILGFILFWEWLRPLEVVTDTGNSIYFVTFAAVCFLLYFLKLPIWASIPIRFVFLLYILHALFFEGSFLQLEWLYRFYADIVMNSQALLGTQWLELTDLFRSFLFLILLWVMSYLMHYWLMQLKRVFGFYILTIIYLGVLDTFTRYDASEAIVRTIVVGFFMLGCLQMARLREKEGVKLRAAFLFPLALMIAFSITIGIHAPKAGPQWPDPVPFIKSAATGQFLGSVVQKIGYDDDDSRLGGSFLNDETTVFTAEDQKSHYWRVESKDFYTGKGWIVSEKAPQLVIDKDRINLGIFENVDKEKNVKAKISFKNSSPYPHIAYPADLRSLQPQDENVQLMADHFTGKLFAKKNEGRVQLLTYEVIYDEPTFSIEALKLANGGDNAYVKGIYTQLPETLPERIEMLAKEITKDKPTRYEKAKAIETYFSGHGFIYDTKNVDMPGEDQDYVDQFLFQSQKGYCDNFSSSMVVLLRSIDIPARWVKGYTEGERVKTLDNGAGLYEVKNSNAHSWVEVYFPGIGWVPFEPTQGFRNPNTFTVNTTPEVLQSNQDVNQQKQNKENEKKANEFNHAKNNMSGISFKNLNVPLKEISIFAVVALLLIGLLIGLKPKWYPYWLLLMYRIRKNKLDPKRAVDTLFLLLENRGLKIQGGETLREFASRVDAKLGSTEMKKMMDVYEKLLYSKKEQSSEDLKIICDLWEKLANRIFS